MLHLACYKVIVQLPFIFSFHCTDAIRHLFKINYAESGCKERIKEECTYVFLVDYLEELESSEGSNYTTICGRIKGLADGI